MKKVELTQKVLSQWHRSYNFVSSISISTERLHFSPLKLSAICDLPWPKNTQKYSMSFPTELFNFLISSVSLPSFDQVTTHVSAEVAMITALSCPKSAENFNEEVNHHLSHQNLGSSLLQPNLC